MAKPKMSRPGADRSGNEIPTGRGNPLVDDPSGGRHAGVVESATAKFRAAVAPTALEGTDHDGRTLNTPSMDWREKQRPDGPAGVVRPDRGVGGPVSD